MNSRFLTVLTIATVTLLSFSSIAKSEDAAQTNVNSPESTAIAQDRTQTTPNPNSSSKTVARTSNNQSDSTNSDRRSSGGDNHDKCGEQ
jgi:hypothetical protein